MLYLGLDVHKKQTTLCALDENGKKLFTRNIKGYWDTVVEEVMKVKKEHQQQIAITFESSCGYGPLHDGLAGIASRIEVAHPGHLRIIFRSKKKHDKIDSFKLAKLLYLDAVPTIHVPDADVRAWREMINFRSGLVSKRTGVKNEIRSLLRGRGVAPPKKLWTKAGIKWLRLLEFDLDLVSFRRDVLLEELASLESQLARVQRLLAQRARRHPGVQLLMTIPGVGIRTAEALVAFIDDPHRFGKVNKIGAYFGLIPSQDQTGDKNHLGHITKEGCPEVRRLATEAGWQAIRRSPTVAAKFEHWMRGDPDRKKIAIIAVAHYLVRVSLAMLKTGEVWREAA